MLAQQRSLHARCGLGVLRQQHLRRLHVPRPGQARRNAVMAGKGNSSYEQSEGPSNTASTLAVPEWAQPSQQQQYQAVPSYQSVPPRAPEPSFWSSIPPLIWVGIGLAIGAGLQKAVEFVKGGPQRMQQMAMEQMMKQMMNQMGAPGGAAANPFGAASPFGAAPGASPFGATASPFGGAPPSGFPSGFPNMQPPIDTTATAAAAPAAAPAGQAAASTATPPPASAATTSTPSTASPKKKSSGFVDVDATPVTEPTPAAAAPSAPGAAPAGAAPGGFGAGGFGAGGFAMPPPDMGAGSAAAGSSAAPGGASGMLEMLRDPEMQKMLYPYLPEPMRNPQTFEWMLNTPEYRQQLEQMLAQQAGAANNPAVAEMMKDIDMSPEAMKKQLGAMGMSPDQFIQKIMSDPDLASSISKPEVMAAIAECTKNPMNIFKYQNDPQVMKVFEKMSALFPQAPGMAGGMPGMPQPGAGFPPQQ